MNTEKDVGQSIVLWGVVAINIIVWFLLQSSSALSPYSIGSQLLLRYAKYTPMILEQGEWWRLVTSGFLHKDAMHLFSNMYSLVVLWNFLQPTLKRFSLFIIYLMSIIGGSCMSLFFNPVTISIGASGGVFGLIAVALIYAIKTDQKHLIHNFFHVIVINSIIGVVGASFIDNWAHLGGVLVGVVAGLICYHNLQKMQSSHSL